jgi:hypothetical protein
MDKSERKSERIRNIRRRRKRHRPQEDRKETR